MTKEQAVLEFLATTIKGTEWEGKVYLAGGAVRDEILGIKIKDIDLLIDEPNGGILFSNWICKKQNIYIEGSNPVVYPTYGTAKFNLRDHYLHSFELESVDIECVMPRTENYNPDSRNPDVTPGTLQDDAFRRDFTVNSLLKNISTGEILDLTGQGIEDIKTGIIRTSWNVNRILEDDPLRMLRAIRFASRNNWRLDKGLEESIKKNAYRIQIISKERIQDELNKMLLSENPHWAIYTMQQLGLSYYIFPELDKLIGLEQNKYHAYDAMQHTSLVLKNTPPDLVTRLAALFHDIGKAKTRTEVNGEIHFYNHETIGSEIAESILKRLRYPNEIIDEVVLLIRNHMRTKSFGDEAKVSDKSIRKLRIDLGNSLEKFLDLVHADNISHSKESNLPNQVSNIRKRLSELEEFTPSQHLKLPVSGKDLMEYFGIPQGSFVGKMLSVAKDAYLNNPEITKEELIKEIKTYFDLKSRYNFEKETRVLDSANYFVKENYLLINFRNGSTTKVDCSLEEAPRLLEHFGEGIEITEVY